MGKDFELEHLKNKWRKAKPGVRLGLGRRYGLKKISDALSSGTDFSDVVDALVLAGSMGLELDYDWYLPNVGYVNLSSKGSTVNSLYLQVQGLNKSESEFCDRVALLCLTADDRNAFKRDWSALRKARFSGENSDINLFEFGNKKREEAKSKKEEWIEKGKSVIFPERHEAWTSFVEDAIEGNFFGTEVQPALDIIVSLQNGDDLKSVLDNASLQYGCPINSNKTVMDTVLKFSGRGPDLYEKYSPEDLTAADMIRIDDLRQENERLASKHSFVRTK